MYRCQNTTGDPNIKEMLLVLSLSLILLHIKSVSVTCLKVQIFCTINSIQGVTRIHLLGKAERTDVLVERELKGELLIVIGFDRMCRESVSVCGRPRLGIIAGKSAET